MASLMNSVKHLRTNTNHSQIISKRNEGKGLFLTHSKANEMIIKEKYRSMTLMNLMQNS